jgi:hypothetical protein
MDTTKIQKGYIKFNYVVCLSDPCSSQSSKLVGGPVPEASKIGLGLVKILKLEVRLA